MVEPENATEPRAPFQCAQWMPLIRPYLPDVLVSEEAFEKIATVARRLPGNVQGAIEIRLGPEPAPVDFSIRVGDPRTARDLAPLLAPEHVRRFFVEWSQDPDPRIPFLWAEFDLDRPTETMKPIFIVRTDGLGAPPVEWVVENILVEKAFGRKIPEPQRQTVLRALDSVPASGVLVYLFDLRSRGTDAVRLDFFGLETSEMIRLLSELGRDDFSESLSAAGDIAASSERFHFNFDVTADGTVSSRVGLEASFSAFPRRGSPWEPLFDRLVAEGLCTADKKEAVFDWPGYVGSRTAGELWPLASEGLPGFLIRTLSHVKLVCRPGEPLESKVYLLFGRHVKGPSGKLEIAT